LVKLFAVLISQVKVLANWKVQIRSK